MKGASMARSASIRSDMHHPHAPGSPLELFDLGERSVRGEPGFTIDLVPLLELAYGYEEGRQGGQAEAGGREHAVLAIGGNEEWRMRALGGPRAHVQALGGMEAPPKIEGRAAP